MGISGERINYNIDTRTHVRYNNSRIATWSYYILLNRASQYIPILEVEVNIGT